MLSKASLARTLRVQQPSEAQRLTPSGFRERSKQRLSFFLAGHGTCNVHGAAREGDYHAQQLCYPQKRHISRGTSVEVFVRFP